MKALVFNGPNDISIQEVPKPEAGYGEVVVKVTLTTICGSDIHILNGGVVIKPGIIMGHEFVGIIDTVGEGVANFKTGDRVAVGAITPCGHCFYCQNNVGAQCEIISTPSGGWEFGNTINGGQAQYVKIINAEYNLALIPDELTDEQVIFVGDIMSTGFSASESANVKIGDSVAIFAQGPVGLCATVGARLRGATKIIAVETMPERREMSKKMGADIVLDPSKIDVVSEIKRLTNGRGVDVAIEALGEQITFENALRSIRLGGTVSSLGVYEKDLIIPHDAYISGAGDIDIITTLCPGGRERLNRLMSVIQSGRADLTPLITHNFTLDDIGAAYELFRKHEDNVIKVAVRPW